MTDREASSGATVAHTHEAISQGIKRQAIKRKSPTSLVPQDPAFKTPEFEAVFRKVIEIIDGENLTEAFKVTITEDDCHITICNLWRLRKTKTANLIWEHRYIGKDGWLSSTAERNGFDLPYLVSSGEGFVNYAISRMETAITMALDLSGVKQVEYDFRVLDPEAEVEKEPKVAFPGEVVSDIRKRISSLYCRPKLGTQAKQMMSAFKQKFIGSEFMEVLTDYARVEPKTASYAAYMLAQQDVIRIYRETPNLLPLLKTVSINDWPNRDLFSAQRWMRHEVKVKVGKNKYRTNLHGTFTSRSAMRWVFSSPPDVIDVWIKSGKDEVALINICRANIKCEVSAPVAIEMLRFHTNTRSMGICSGVQVMYRLFAEACAEVVRVEGLEALDRFIEREHVGFVGDWLSAEGLIAGHPGKNATWETLSRHAALWRVGLQNLQLVSKELNENWTYPIRLKTLNGAKFTGLLSLNALISEGSEQEHCVSSYWKICSAGHYAVFKVVHEDGYRTTLGLRKASKVHWLVEQHYGSKNSLVYGHRTQVGEDFAVFFSKTYEEVVRKAEAEAEAAKVKARATADSKKVSTRRTAIKIDKPSDCRATSQSEVLNLTILN